MGYYDVAQICLNGHLITDRFAGWPQFRKDFCSKCGQATIYQCPECKQMIQGDYVVPGVLDLSGYQPDPPSYCHACGKPYPWKAAKIEAAQAMIDELDELNGAEREVLRKSIDDIAVDSPMTEVAVTRFKKMLPKLTQESAAAMRRLVIDVAGKVGAELLKGGM